MFVSYDCVTFGERIREVRQGLRLSQKAVYDATGINTDTLRRIEHGTVIPKFETLEVLSHLYKKNLLHVLDACKGSNVLMRFYDEIDSVIIKKSYESLVELKRKLEKIESIELFGVDGLEYSRFKSFVTALTYSFEGDERVIDQLYETLQMKHKDFSVACLDNYYFNHFDYKILLVLAVALAEAKRLEESDNLLEYLIEHYPVEKHAKQVVKEMYVKVIINLAYNKHLEDNHKKAYDLANRGIAYCQENNLLYGLHLLYYRKGIAEKFLHEPYKQSLDYSLQLMEMQGFEGMKNHYKKVLVKTYNIAM